MNQLGGLQCAKYREDEGVQIQGDLLFFLKYSIFKNICDSGFCRCFSFLANILKRECVTLQNIFLGYKVIAAGAASWHGYAPARESGLLFCISFNLVYTGEGLYSFTVQ